MNMILAVGSVVATAIVAAVVVAIVVLACYFTARGGTPCSGCTGKCGSCKFAAAEGKIPKDQNIVEDKSGGNSGEISPEEEKSGEARDQNSDNRREKTEENQK